MKLCLLLYVHLSLSVRSYYITLWRCDNRECLQVALHLENSNNEVSLISLLEQNTIQDACNC